MCIVHQIRLFILSGWQTFRLSSRGRYDYESEEVRNLRREMFSLPQGGTGDAANMHHDRLMVGRDMRAGLKKITLTNG